METTLHGQKVVMPVGYAYATILARHPRYNAPLVSAVAEAYRCAGRPISVVDVGAGVGDTVLLIMERCPDQVEAFVCIDGDAEFFRFLSANLRNHPQCELIRVIVSDADGLVPGLIRTHPGTASAQGATAAAATTLDAVLEGRSVEVVKIDTDGFDGRVLGGAVRTLEEQRPLVAFEWHPGLCRATGNDWRLPFEILEGAGYDRFLWFSKVGDFSHMEGAGGWAGREVIADVCVEELGPMPDWHYDVVALPVGHGADAVRIVRGVGTIPAR